MFSIASIVSVTILLSHCGCTFLLPSALLKLYKQAVAANWTPKSCGCLCIAGRISWNKYENKFPY